MWNGPSSSNGGEGGQFLDWGLWDLEVGTEGPAVNQSHPLSVAIWPKMVPDLVTLHGEGHGIQGVGNNVGY